MVAIRHSVSTSDQQRTTMILLCEDGSLRVFMASAEHTGYWMAPEFQPVRSVACCTDKFKHVHLLHDVICILFSNEFLCLLH